MSLTFCVWFVAADAVVVLLVVTLSHLWISKHQLVRDEMHNALHGVSQMIGSGTTFEVLGKHSDDCGCRKCKSQLSNFVRRRIDEHEDLDEAETLRELWNAAYDQVALHHEGQKPNFVRGEVKNLRALRELARQWREHPDYREAWDRWMWGE